MMIDIDNVDESIKAILFQRDLMGYALDYAKKNISMEQFIERVLQLIKDI